MVSATLINIRPIVDIEEDIRKFIRSYDPLKQARQYFSYEVDANGKVTLVGNVRSVQARRVLVDNIPDIAGVTELDDSSFFDDEDMRLELGRLTPSGVIVRVNFGYVVLTGHLPPHTEEAELAAEVAAYPGVRKVVTKFY